MFTRLIAIALKADSLISLCPGASLKRLNVSRTCCENVSARNLDIQEREMKPNVCRRIFTTTTVNRRPL